MILIFILISFYFSCLNSQGVSNNPFWREQSDRLDKFMGWEGDRKYESAARGFIHGVYHEAVGVAKFATQDWKGAQAEHNRAQEQFNRAGQQFETGFRKILKTPPPQETKQK